MKKQEDVIDLTSAELTFTFDDEVPLDKYEEDKAKLELVLAKISNLLKNLKANPDKPIIKWPNRIADIEKFEKELEQIMKGN